MADQLITGTTLIEDKRAETGRVWSCSGANFKPYLDDGTTNRTLYDADGTFLNIMGRAIIAPVDLPNGVEITGFIVYADAVVAGDWQLKRVNHLGTSTEMATAESNIEDNTITSEIIDNSNYSYFIVSIDTSNSTEVYGAKITYKT